MCTNAPVRIQSPDICRAISPTKYRQSKQTEDTVPERTCRQQLLNGAQGTIDRAVESSTAVDDGSSMDALQDSMMGVVFGVRGGV